MMYGDKGQCELQPCHAQCSPALALKHGAWFGTKPGKQNQSVGFCSSPTVLIKHSISHVKKNLSPVELCNFIVIRK